MLGAFAACMAVAPACAAEGVPEMLNVFWGKNTFNFESMPSGAPAMRNLSRLPNGKANAGQQVGDYNNPILKPEAAATRQGEGRARQGRRLSQFARSVPHALAAVFLRDDARSDDADAQERKHHHRHRSQLQHAVHPHERLAPGQS
jgi:hypothetical protein